MSIKTSRVQTETIRLRKRYTKYRNMRRGYIIIAAVITMLICAGCSFGELEYDMNLGYDLNKVKSKDITFNVYQVNPEDHSWERIASFPCTPEPGHYNDVKIEGEKGKIKAVLSDNTYTESDDGNSAAYDGVVVSSFEYDVDGFKGDFPGWKSFAVRDEEGEQMVRLYPISNSGSVSFLEDISLDKPYDLEETGGETLDNILITIVMK